MARRHVVISGTGRAGTTFLVELFTYLGLDTGYTQAELEERKDKTARAGLEHDIREPECPYVVKSPHFCDIAEDVVADGDVVIEHVLIPMRDLYAAAESRRRVGSVACSEWSLWRRMASSLRPKKVRGGLWHTSKGHEQEMILLQQLYKLTLALANSDIPVTLLRFPRLVNDPAYLLQKLAPILPGISDEQFRTAFEQTANPALVHHLSPNDG